MSEEGSVRVIERACQVLDCFSKQAPRLQIADIRERTGLPSTTVGRIVKTLVSQRLLERDGNEYCLGLRVLVWSAPANAASDLIMAATPVVDYIRDVTGETSGISVRQGASRVSVATSLSPQSIICNIYVGQIMPLHVGAAGKIFMALDDSALDVALSAGLSRLTEQTTTDAADLRRQLETVRATGWSYASEERELGLSSIAAPIYGSSGTIAAAIAIGGPTFRLTSEVAERFGPLIEAAGQCISQKLGFTGRISALAEELSRRH